MEKYNISLKIIKEQLLYKIKFIIIFTNNTDISHFSFSR